MIERDGGTLYCTAVFIDPRHGLVAHHRKLMPTAAERFLWGQGDGSTMPAVHTDFGVLGAAICWENYMPLFRQAMYAKGVEIWCAPTVDDRDQWQATMRHVALEGRCFVIGANQYLTRADLPDDVHPIQGDAPATVLIDGGSVIVSPLGEILAGPLRGGEGVLRRRARSRRPGSRASSTSMPSATTRGRTCSPCSPTSRRSTPSYPNQ